MAGKATTLGGSSHRLILSSSFVVTIDSRTLLATPVEFLIGKGGWVVQAKATIRANPDQVDVQVRLSATADATTVDDRSKTSANNLGYSTVVATLGVSVSTTAVVQIELTQQGLQNAEISGIVISAIHQDDLTILAM